MAEEMLTIKEKYSRWIRWSHWLNVVFLSLMIWSGILIYWAHQAYLPLPAWFVKLFNINNHLADGIAWHFTIMWCFVLNGLVYMGYLVWSSEWRELVPLKRSFKDAVGVVAHDLKIKKQLPGQIGRVNGAQRFAYSIVIVLALLIILSGIAIYKPVQTSFLTELLGGYPFARKIHFYTMIALILFIVVHLAQVVRAGWNNLRAMIAGYER